MKRSFLVAAGLLFVLPLQAALAAAGQGASILKKSDDALNRIFQERSLSQDVKVKVGGQARYRFELRNNFNLNDRAYEDDAMNLLRTRLNLDVHVTPYARFFVEGQEAHSFAQSQADKSTAFVDALDLRQLFAELKSPSKEVPVTAKVGRQTLSYGDERFVGASEWTNPSRVFDALKLVYNPSERAQVDVFASRVVRVDREQWDPTPHNDNFYGIYASTKPFKNHKDQILDAFLFIRHNTDRSVAGERAGERGPLKEYTFGNRFKGKLSNFDYGTEYAIQLGSRSHDEIQAWAFHQELGYTLSSFLWTPRVYGEFNHASGDRDPSDGRSQTFDNLFPTNHNKYGYMDFVALKNINDFMMGTSVKPHPKVLLSSDFHWFVLDAKESAWYNAGGGAFRAANAAADTHLGEEIDLLATYKLTDHLSFLGGYSHFFAGPFAKDTGAHDDADFFYLQSQLNF